MQKAHRNGLDTEVAQAARGRLDARLVEGGLDRAVEAHALGDLDAQAARHQRRRIGDAEVEQVVAALETHIHDVGEAGRAEHSRGRPLALDDGIGDECRAVHDVGHIGEGDAAFLAVRDHTLDHGTRGIVRRRQPLVNREALGAALRKREIRESAADVDADPEHARRYPFVSRSRSQ